MNALKHLIITVLLINFFSNSFNGSQGVLVMFAYYSGHLINSIGETVFYVVPLGDAKVRKPKSLLGSKVGYRWVWAIKIRIDSGWG